MSITRLLIRYQVYSVYIYIYILNCQSTRSASVIARLCSHMDLSPINKYSHTRNTYTTGPPHSQECFPAHITPGLATALACKLHQQHTAPHPPSQPSHVGPHPSPCLHRRHHRQPARPLPRRHRALHRTSPQNLREFPRPLRRLSRQNPHRHAPPLLFLDLPPNNLRLPRSRRRHHSRERHRRPLHLRATLPR